MSKTHDLDFTAYNARQQHEAAKKRNTTIMVYFASVIVNLSIVGVMLFFDTHTIPMMVVTAWVCCTSFFTMRDVFAWIRA